MTYLNDKARPHVAPLAAELGAALEGSDRVNVVVVVCMAASVSVLGHSMWQQRIHSIAVARRRPDDDLAALLEEIDAVRHAMARANAGDLVVLCGDKHPAVMAELENWSNQAQAVWSAQQASSGAWTRVRIAPRGSVFYGLHLLVNRSGDAVIGWDGRGGRRSGHVAEAAPDALGRRPSEPEPRVVPGVAEHDLHQFDGPRIVVDEQYRWLTGSPGQIGLPAG